jgi:hypothetical protein
MQLGCLIQDSTNMCFSCLEPIVCFPGLIILLYQGDLMAESDGNTADPYAGLTTGLSGPIHPRTMDPGFKMTYSEVTRLGKHVAGHGPALSASGAAIDNIRLANFAFGAIGQPLSGAHDTVRTGAADAMKKCKEVLDSWKSALDGVIDNTKKAEQKSSNGGGNGPGPYGGLPDVPGFGTSGLGDGLSGIGKPDFGDGTGGLVKGTPGLGDAGLPSTELPSTGLPSTDLPSTDLPSTDLPSTGLPSTGLPSTDPPDLNQPGLDGTAPKLDPSDISTPSLSIGDKGSNLADFTPATPTGTEPRATGSTFGPGEVPMGASYSTGPGPASGVTSGITGRGVSSGGAPFMPLPPMMGGGMGSDGEKGRDRGASVTEDEATWDGHHDLAPPIIGLEE